MLSLKALVSPTTKTKTMIFVLMLFMAMTTMFGWLRYLDVKDAIEKSRKDYALQIHSIYQMTLQKTTAFYINRAYANLDSYGIKEALEEKDVGKLTGLSSFRWKVLKQENPFLQGIHFYDDSLNLVAYLGQEPSREELRYNHVIPLEPTFGFFFSNTYVAYHIVVPVRVNDKVIGMLEFTISPEFFLNEVEQFSGLQGHLILKGDEATSLQGVESKNGVLSQKGHQTFITHVLKLKEDDNEDRAQLLFFQDISKQQQRLVDATYEAFFLALGVMGILLIILNYGFNVLIKRLEESETNLRYLNHTLEDRVSFEIQQRMENEQILMHQSRLASMGEMIGNIAHQWRQPLTELGALLMNLQVLWDKKKLDNAMFEDRISRCENSITYMSKTIDDFRNFFATDKQKELYCINDAIKKAVLLIESALKNHHITLIVKEEHRCMTQGYPSQFSQAILNIISNAKDILLERFIVEPTIWIEITCKEDKASIRIADNGGGISIEPIEKVFEPYVSTKHAMSGTGIGLYMSKTIIEKNAQGSLKAYNSDIGAVFEIII